MSPPRAETSQRSTAPVPAPQELNAMARQNSLDPAQLAKRAAVEAVAAVVDKHLRLEAVKPTIRDDPDAPVLLHVDGPGKSQFLDALEQRLDPFAPVRGRC